MNPFGHIMSEQRIDGTIMLAIVCPFCAENGTVLIIPEAGYDAWRGGAVIQEALPGLTTDQRECLITGICPACFPPDPEEEEPFEFKTESL